MAHRFARVSALLAVFFPALALLGGCAAPYDASDQEEGYILLDRDAQRVFSMELDGWTGTPLLPMAAAPSSVITLSAAHGKTVVIRPVSGMLAYVHDEDGEIEWLEVGRDARPDRLLLHGLEASAKDLALMLGGKVAARGDGLWNLTSPDILTKTSFMEPPAGLLEALPDTAIDTGDIDPIGGSGAAILGPDLGALGADPGDDAPGRREALFVGVYASVDAMLILDASGRFSEVDRCNGDLKREGHYYVSGGRVALQSRGAQPVSLAIDNDSLVPPSGDRLRTLDPWWALGSSGEKK